MSARSRNCAAPCAAFSRRAASYNHRRNRNSATRAGISRVVMNPAATNLAVIIAIKTSVAMNLVVRNRSRRLPPPKLPSRHRLPKAETRRIRIKIRSAP